MVPDVQLLLHDMGIKLEELLRGYECGDVIAEPFQMKAP